MSSHSRTAHSDGESAPAACVTRSSMMVAVRSEAAWNAFITSRNTYLDQSAALMYGKLSRKSRAMATVRRMSSSPALLRL